MRSRNCNHPHAPKRSEWVMVPRQVATEVRRTESGYRAFPEYLWDWGFSCRDCGAWVCG